MGCFGVDLGISFGMLILTCFACAGDILFIIEKISCLYAWKVTIIVYQVVVLMNEGLFLSIVLSEQS